MKVSNYANLQNITTLPELVRYTTIDINLIIAVINGNIDLIQNCSTQLLSVKFLKPNTSYPFAHSLGRVPNGFLNVGMNFGAAVFNGTNLNTITQLYLQAGSTGSGKVLVF